MLRFNLTVLKFFNQLTYTITLKIILFTHSVPFSKIEFSRKNFLLPSFRFRSRVHSNSSCSPSSMNLDTAGNRYHRGPVETLNWKQSIDLRGIAEWTVEQDEWSASLHLAKIVDHWVRNFTRIIHLS